ncbi:hypothetical protein Y1Q_0012419 [Alligator mississippiensis]|nr:hypothetical protein Y1Q_0012419 [Alligator mississippiensis]
MSACHHDLYMPSWACLPTPHHGVLPSMPKQGDPEVVVMPAGCLAQLILEATVYHAHQPGPGVAMACHGMCFHVHEPPASNPTMPSHRTLCLPSLQGWATNFHVVNEDEAIQDTMDARVLQHHLETVKYRFGVCTTSINWWEWIVMGTWDNEQWIQTFRMSWASFMDVVAQMAPQTMCQDVSM